MLPRQARELRQAVLAVAVLDDLDLQPGDDGVRVLRSAVQLGWDEIAAAVGDALPDLGAARWRIRGWLQVREALARVADTPGLGAVRLRLVGLPCSRIPDADWMHQRVLGGAVLLGLGVVTDSSADLPVVPVPSLALRASGLASPGLRHLLDWPRMHEHLEAMGVLAGQRLARIPSQLAPMGDCDVTTLLGSTALREALVAGCTGGMRTAAVPSRRRGWLDLRRLDPAFTSVAYELTPTADQAFERPLLLTASEVALVPEGGRRAEIDLRDDSSPVRAGQPNRMSPRSSPPPQPPAG